MTPTGANVQDRDDPMRDLEELVSKPLYRSLGAQGKHKRDQEYGDYTKDDILRGHDSAVLVRLRLVEFAFYNSPAERV